MAFLELRRFALCACASLIMLAGCGGADQVPLLSSGGVAQTVSLGKSWISSQWRSELRNAHHRKRLLLYVGVAGYPGAVDILDYKTGALMGQLLDVFVAPDGLCSDPKGNVYVADYSLDEGFEIQAGTTNVVKSWQTDGSANGCAVSENGDVAFTNFKTGPSGGGNVEVFPGGAPSGVVYPGPGYNDMPAAYDNKGNLFETCDTGPCTGSSPELWELPAGGSSWMPLSSKSAIPWAPIEWDGKYLAILCDISQSRRKACIDQVTVSGSTAKVVNIVRFSADRGCGRYLAIDNWAEDAKRPDGQTTSPATQIAALDSQCNPAPILVWSYPSGGAPKRIIHVAENGLSATIVKV